MYRLYGMTGSGNCYKPVLAMTQLGIPFEWIEVDLLNGATRTPEFLAKNPNGKVPLLELPDGRTLSESNAILHFVAEGSALLPDDRFERARVLQWLFFEQYSHEPYIATVRFWVHYLHKADEWRDRIADAMKKGHAALGVMERQLERSPFLTGDRYTLADIALYAYTHVAHQGGYTLDDYPQVRGWLGRVATQQRYRPMLQEPAERPGAAPSQDKPL